MSVEAIADMARKHIQELRAQSAALGVFKRRDAMGCDMDVRVHARTASGWRDVTPLALGEDPWKHPATYRSYKLFAFIADVRNGSGFDRIRPQFAWRGAHECYPPLDDEWSISTYATLAELRRAPWGVIVRERGSVHLDAYRAWKASGDPCPSSWSAGVVGPGIATIDEADIDKPHAARDIYVRTEWTWQPLIDCAFRQWADALDPVALGAGSADDVVVTMEFNG